VLNPEKDGVLKIVKLSHLKMVALLYCFLLVVACGYGFIPDGEAIDKNIQKIFVDVFINKTSEANIENTFRTAFIDQVIQGRRFKIAGSPGEADAILKGSIESLSAAALSYQATNLAAEDNRRSVPHLGGTESQKCPLGKQQFLRHPGLSHG
jgi:hypothetical protein